MINPQEVGRRLYDHRQARGMSQQEVAALMSVTHQAVSKWETGVALPDMQILLALSRLYHTTMEALLTGEGMKVVHQAAPAPPPQEKAAEEDLPRMAISDIISMLPFLQESTINALLDRALDEPDTGELMTLAAFANPSYLAGILRKLPRPVDQGLLHCLMPFLPAGVLDEMLFAGDFQKQDRATPRSPEPPASPKSPEPPVDKPADHSAHLASRAHQALAQGDEDWIDEHAAELKAEDLLTLCGFARHADAEESLHLLLEHADPKEVQKLMKLAMEKQDWDLVQRAARTLT